jgi:DNA polymerase III subunit gamma/tau
MLSKGAFNALLKILEEPPSHVKFILATTETHKVPETIISRCQRYDFKRISAEDIKNRLLYIAKEESVNIDEKSLNYIVKNSG